EQPPRMPRSSPNMTFDRQLVALPALLLQGDRAQRVVGAGIGMVMMGVGMGVGRGRGRGRAMTVVVPLAMGVGLPGMIVMVMVVVVIVVVIMVMTMIVMVMMARLAGADTLDVMVVALLSQADLRLEAQHLRSVLAELAVHQVLAV